MWRKWGIMDDCRVSSLNIWWSLIKVAIAETLKKACKINLPEIQSSAVLSEYLTSVLIFPKVCVRSNISILDSYTKFNFLINKWEKRAGITVSAAASNLVHNAVWFGYVECLV